ncbi:MAG: YfgM family protein [Legionella sp.]
MSVYMTEKEQLDIIKKWWQRHSNTVTLIASIILLLVAGLKYWYWHQQKSTQQASNTYEQMMVAFSNKDNKSTRAYANQLLKEHNNSIYADAARLTLAKLFIEHAKFSDAQTQLRYVAEHSSTSAIQQIAKLRIARLLIAEKSYEKALEQLDVVNPAYDSLINEIKGDIYAATGLYQQAIASYRTAIEQAQSKGITNIFLEMKTSDMAALTSAEKS